jgi:Fe2+ transport system protein FeoA
MTFNRNTVFLEDLRAGEVGRVEKIEGAPRMVRRLHELGLRQGAMVEMLQPGPTMIVRVSNQKLWLRRYQGIRIHVNCDDGTTLSPSALSGEVCPKGPAIGPRGGTDGEESGVNAAHPGRRKGRRFRFRLAWGLARGKTGGRG